jgi:r-opsin
MASSLWSIVVMNRSVSLSGSNCQHGHHQQPQEKNDVNNNHSDSSSSSTSISTVDWDDWDESLWTDEQRQWLETGSVPREVYVTMSVMLSLVVVFGLIANATILYVFSRSVKSFDFPSLSSLKLKRIEFRFKRLRTPANVLVMNLTACDFISCLIHPMAIYSAYRGRWSFGKTGKHFKIPFQ